MAADRDAQIQTFLSRAGWEGAQRAALAGDASQRRYERLTGGPGPGRAVLMNAPIENGEDVRPFLSIAQHLHDLGLSAPKCLAKNPARGLLLLEDLGDNLFARILETQPDLESKLYFAAVDVLIELHQYPPPASVKTIDPTEFATQTELVIDWYGAKVEDSGKQAFLAELVTVLTKTSAPKSVLALRDFHAENLIWLPERAGLARVGLLDFQDAFRGHPAYDLVSLTKDARRDVPPALADDLLTYYVERTGQQSDRFQAAAAAIAAQRNLRILGIFARLSLHFGKPDYVDLIPRVWQHLMRDLAHPQLSDLRRLVRQTLPEPSPETLNDLRCRCGTIPIL